MRKIARIMDVSTYSKPLRFILWLRKQFSFNHKKIPLLFWERKKECCHVRARVGAPPPSNPNLIKFLFFHPIGYLKTNKNWFEPVSSDLILHDQILSLLILLNLIWTYLFLLYLVWSSFIQFDPIWSNLVHFGPINVIKSALIWFESIWTNLNQLDPTWSNLNV